MGGVISSIASAINSFFSAILHVLTSIVSGIANVLKAIVSCLTCGKCGGGRRSGGHTTTV